MTLDISDFPLLLVPFAEIVGIEEERYLNALKYDCGLVYLVLKMLSIVRNQTVIIISGEVREKLVTNLDVHVLTVELNYIK